MIVNFTSCKNPNQNISTQNKLVEEAFEILKHHSVNKNNIDWHALKIDIYNKANNAKTIEETYNVIDYAVSKLNDKHSYFVGNTKSAENENQEPLPIYYDEDTPNDIAYLRIPYCIGTEDQLEMYIKNIKSKIKQHATKQPKGWILDLRDNFGGNMWPMLLAIEPLIGNGVFGYFYNTDGNYKAWVLNKGKAYIDNELVLESSSKNVFFLDNQILAVLTNEETASSGEAITIALKSTNYTKSFGTPTYGVSTGCVTHHLSDGSRINLAETVFADKNKLAYGFSIPPDSIVSNELALKVAIDWIYNLYENTN